MTALIGINSMLISIVLPIVFYYMLHRRSMGRASRILHLGLVAVAIAFTAVISSVDVDEFLRSLHRLQGGGGGNATSAAGGSDFR